MFALGIVHSAEDALWSDRGAEAREYLHGRGLTEQTIRSARLGSRAEDAYIEGVYSDARLFVAAGIVIPWFDGESVTLVNIRRPAGDPRYLAMKGSRRGGLYPSRSPVEVGRPLVIVEGELDALLLGQELAGLASVVTLGTAGDRPKASTLGAMLGASPWLIASDADGAGEASSSLWLARSDRCRRVRPPIGKDWTEAHQRGVDLRAWWLEILAENGTDPSARLVSDPVESAEGFKTTLAPPPSPLHIFPVLDEMESQAEAFEERAAIFEYDGGLPRAEAERWALEYVKQQLCPNFHACV